MARNSTYNGTVKSIDTELFDATIATFRRAIDIYRNTREGVFRSTDKLVTVWEGEGEEAFEKAYKVLKTQLKDEENNLRTLAEDLENMKQSYVDWDTEISRQFKGE